VALGLSVAAIVGLGWAFAHFGPAFFAAALSLRDRLSLSGAMLFVGCSLFAYVPMGVGWWSVTRSPRPSVVHFIWARMLREAAADLLPFSQVGGIVVGIRSLTGRTGLTIAAATTAFVADLGAELASQAVFTSACVAALVFGLAHAPAEVIVEALATIAVCAALGLLLCEPRLVRRLLTALASRVVPAATSALASSPEWNRRQLFASFLANLSAWVMSAACAWIALRTLGVDAPLGRVLILESLVFCIRTAAFPIPGGIGVQETGYAILGPLLGFAMEDVLALAVFKRIRDVVIALPVLLVWQANEWRTLAPRMRGD
jgi:putative membrane protein